ncbi:unnamed protein product, partial [Brachionus calyciflorus]
MNLEELTYIESNFGIEKVKNSHPVVIFKNFRYWWRIENKDSSHRYVCSESNCYASIRIKENKVIKEGDLKKEVTSDITKSIQMCYNQAQIKLIQSGISEHTIAAKFKPFKTISNTLHKRPVNKLPTIPSDFSQLEITDEYCLTAKNQAFLRYDNKKPDNR